MCVGGGHEESSRQSQKKHHRVLKKEGGETGVSTQAENKELQTLFSLRIVFNPPAERHNHGLIHSCVV